MVAFVLLLVGCDNESWLYKDPTDVLTDEEVWSDASLVESALANLYNRLPTFRGGFNSSYATEWDDAMFSGSGDNVNTFQFEDYEDYGYYWDYDLIYDINYDLENLEEYKDNFTDEEYLCYEGEIRFIRAFVYFELVKRMGGVPLVTSVMQYNNDGDASYLQVARSTEAECYSFVYNECEAIKDNLSSNEGSRTRANKYTVLALESRSMLYAASTAKYNSLMDNPLSTDGGEVGIPADSATSYYNKSLAASKEIIANTGEYQLVDDLSSDAGENFYDILMDKDNDGEIIFAKDYLGDLTKIHYFTYENIPKSFSEDTDCSSEISPSYGLVESYQYLDGSDGTIKYMDEEGNYILYDDMADIFANKDGRLWGTVIYPGATFKGKDVSIQAGVAIRDDATGEYTFDVSATLGDTYNDGELYTGSNGPVNGDTYISNTGFYIRKFISEESGASSRNTLATNWWPYFRMGEIYLNAGEAAWELGESDAVDYINAVRKRAGFTDEAMLTSLTLNDFVRERRCELAFEDQRFFDLKRWRLADKIWDNDTNDDNCMVSGLYPYRVISNDANYNDKYIFRKLVPTRKKNAKYFVMGNYYPKISSDVISNNPKIVQNPNH